MKYDRLFRMEPLVIHALRGLKGICGVILIARFHKLIFVPDRRFGVRNLTHGGKNKKLTLSALFSKEGGVSMLIQT